MLSLAGKTILIVGASSGIGLATARRTAVLGAHCVMISRSTEKLERAAREVDGSREIHALDMLDEAAISDLITRIETIDHLVMTAVADENKRRARLADLTVEQVERSLDKFRGFFLFVRGAARKIAKDGSITCVSGASALKPPREGMSVLSATNAAIIRFARALALELAPTRVNTVTPGVVDTAVWGLEQRRLIKAWAESPDLPARHFGQPDDIADAIIFLIHNPYMTGHNLVIDGGLTAS
jgi:NAD(P)-dependent dehydrogenase (short-subunit alcohol dehydrogenase family)